MVKSGAEDITDDTTVISDTSVTPAEVCSQYIEKTTTTAAPTTTTTTTGAPTTTTTTTAAPTTTKTTTATTITKTTATTTTTAASKPTTTTISQTTLPNSCSCNCSMLSKFVSSSQSNPEWTNMTTEEKVEYFVVKLRVDKTKLSTTERKKSSAKDDRAVSKSVGYLSIVFMCIEFGLLFLSDGTNLVRYLLKKLEGTQNSINNINENEVDTPL